MERESAEREISLQKVNPPPPEKINPTALKSHSEIASMSLPMQARHVQANASFTTSP